MKKSTTIVFIALLIDFALILSFMLGPVFHQGFLIIIGAFFVLGLLLVFLTLRQKIEGKLKLFLLLTGGSASGQVVFIFVHNLLFGLLGIEEAVSFLLATIAFPAVFVIGAVGSAVLLLSRR